MFIKLYVQLAIRKNTFFIIFFLFLVIIVEAYIKNYALQYKFIYPSKTLQFIIRLKYAIWNTQEINFVFIYLNQNGQNK